MALTKTELALARDAARTLLDRVGLSTYLFEVEPRAGAWAVHVEHPREGAWHEVTLVTGRDELLRCIDDRVQRDALARRWRDELGVRDAA